MSDKNYEAETITLDFEGGESVECAPLGVFEADGKEYIALIPVDAVEGEEEVFIYRFYEEEDGSVIENIEDDAEYEIAGNAFDEWVATFEVEE